MSHNYGVGYGKPPKVHQFKKGKSGNPGGRPKRKPPDAADFAAILNEPVRVRHKGKDKKIGSFEAYVRGLAKRALSDVRAAIEFLRLCDSYGVTPAVRKTSRGCGVQVVPASWDQEEWKEMFDQHGPPPWPGDRPGLPDAINPPRHKRRPNDR